MASLYDTYSVLNASTGSFFAAILDGLLPAITLSNILNKIKNTEPPIPFLYC